MKTFQRSESWPDDPQRVGVIIVDHGSRRRESNERLHDVVALFKENTGYAIVEAAHMELAEPSIETAYRCCVERGADSIIICPFFLLPGKHWTADIPAITRQAASQFPDTTYLVTAPLGIHSLIIDVMNQRIEDCLAFQSGSRDHCDLCDENHTCQIAGGSDAQPVP